MRRLALDAAAPAVDALVRDRRHHAGRLADDAQARREAGIAQVGDQVRNAEAARLFVEAERIVHRMRQVGREQALGLCHHGAYETLHVCAAAAVQPPVLDHRTERLARPRLPIPRHRVGVAGQDHAVGLADTERREQVGLAPVVAVGQADLHREPAQVIGDALDQRQVRFAADGVEAHQALRPIESRGSERHAPTLAADILHAHCGCSSVG